uniref:Uncharacterized protein n=1 Tax=Arundo donax TaxID=35708 RepID=A0A0A9CB90_ARUDO
MEAAAAATPRHVGNYGGWSASSMDGDGTGGGGSTSSLNGGGGSRRVGVVGGAGSGFNGDLSQFCFFLTIGSKSYGCRYFC